MKIADAAFTVFDVETTGLYPYAGDRICEIGAIRVAKGGGSVLKKYHALVDPQRAISSGAFAVNGITREMLDGKPTIDKVLPGFMKFIRGSVLVAYNAGFDLGFLESSLEEGRDILDRFYIVDALSLARKLFPDIGRYNLGSVAAALDISVGTEHRALSDAMMTWKIFEKELMILKASGVKTIEEIDRVLPMKKPRPRMHVSDYKTGMIEDAIRLQKKLNITYRSSWNNKLTRREITPRKIQSGYDRSYLVAHCHMRNEERIFRLDCIVSMDAEK